MNKAIEVRADVVRPTDDTGGSPLGGASARRALTRRRSLVIGVLLVALLLISVASLAIGAKAIAPGDVFSALIHGGDSDNTRIIRDLRVPRTLLGLAVGAALGLGGALMQAVTRNPLADPGLLGVSAGSSLAVVTAIALFGVQSTINTVWFALLGAAIASTAVYVLGTRGPSTSGPARLALAGAAVTAALLSIVRGLILLKPAVFESFRFWIVGSVAGRPLSVLTAILPFIVIGGGLALALARSLNALALGDDLAAALGGRPGRTRALGALAVVLLAGAATAAAGPIVFVGLIIPHGVRLLTGPDQRWILPGSMIAGPVLLLLADIVGRVIDPPGEVEVGVCVAVIGAPLFILLVRRRRLAEL